MKPDFDSSIVLANTARALRSEILSVVHEEQARLTLIRVIAVIESHLGQLAAIESDAIDDGSSDAALMAHDGPMLAAFGGRLRDDQDGIRDGSRDDPA